ncbi:MAG: hypothetical protein QCH99_06520 [Candidatus Bathyarchaeota archaeon]|nr:hypothetical protein [Candidatus Bathyarchaeum tardum]WGM89839.1 MAG: hypothetical protein NUK63_01565 [Candidatus Bathyarchaeum tardum]
MTFFLSKRKYSGFYGMRVRWIVLMFEEEDWDEDFDDEDED